MAGGVNRQVEPALGAGRGFLTDQKTAPGVGLTIISTTSTGLRRDDPLARAFRSDITDDCRYPMGGEPLPLEAIAREIFRVGTPVRDCP